MLQIHFLEKISVFYVFFEKIGLFYDFLKQNLRKNITKSIKLPENRYGIVDNKQRK